MSDQQELRRELQSFMLDASSAFDSDDVEERFSEERLLKLKDMFLAHREKERRQREFEERLLSLAQEALAERGEG